MADHPTEAGAPAVELPKTKEKLDELTKAASLQYSLKEFSASADHYADAVAIQAELNGEMAPENAELLFYYGRALYKVAIAKSDVLGSKVAQEEKKKPKAKKAAKEDAGEGASAAANGAKTEEDKEEKVASKPYFQLTGDENWTDSEDEDEEEGEGQEQEAEQDDFGDAYEMFELARVLYEKQLEAITGGQSSDKGKTKAELTPQTRAIKEKIADCHYYLVEIAFENERFHDAIPDARASLALQEELHPLEHENVTESHFILSLALEYASVKKIREQQAGKTEDTPAADDAQEEEVIDWELRNEAIQHVETAIESLKARLKQEEGLQSSSALTPEQKTEKATIIQDKQAMLEELNTRLADLKEDPTKQQYDTLDSSVVQGLLGGLLGADPATQKAKLAEATQSANDISGLVRTRKKEKAPTPASGAGSKRQLEVPAADASDENEIRKRQKTEEMQ